MKKGIFVTAFLVLASVTFAQASELRVSTRGQIPLLDVEGRSCRLQIAGPQTAPNDLDSVSALIGSFNLRWEGPNVLNLKYLRIRFHGVGVSEYVVTYAGQDLAYIWSGSPSLAPVQSGAQDQISTQSCSFQVGGIPIANKSESFTGKGTLMVYGTTLEGNNEVAVQAETPFNFAFHGIN